MDKDNFETRFLGVIPKRPKKASLKGGILWTDFFLILLFIVIGISVAFLIPNIKMKLINWVVKLIVFLVVTFTFSAFLIPIGINSMRIYNWIWYWFSFSFLDKKEFKKGLTKSDSKKFNPYWKINDSLDSKFNNFLVLGNEKEALYMNAIEFSGLNIFQLDDIEKQNLINVFHKIIEGSDLDLQIAKLSLPTNRENNNKHLSDLIIRTNEEYKSHRLNEKQFKARKKVLESYTEKYYTKLNEKVVHFEDKYFLIVYSSNELDLFRELNRISGLLSSKGLENKICNKYENINLILKSLIPEQPDLSNKIIDNSANNLSDILSFNKIKFSNNHFEIEDKKAFFRISTVTDFPMTAQIGWMFELFNNNSTVVLNIKQNLKDLNKFLSKNIMNLDLNQENINQTKVIDIQQMELEKEIYSVIVNDIAAGKEKLKNFSAMICVSGSTKEEVIKQSIEIKKQLKNSSLNLYDLSYRQQEAFDQFFIKPYTPLDKEINRLMPAYSIALGYPFISNSLNDENGNYLGDNLSNNQIIWNQWERPKGLRTNHNYFVVGRSGSGKSVLMKKTVIWNTVSFVNTYLIDVENEYSPLASFLGEQIIHMGYNENIINPLQIMATPSEKDNIDIQADISNYLLFLSNWFKLLYNEALEFDLGWLIKQISLLYFDWKAIKKAINEKRLLNTLKNEDFPTISDLIVNLKKSLLTNKAVELDGTIKYWINTLKQDFEDGGKYQVMLNQYSTIDINNSNLVVFDVKTIMDIKNTKLKEAIMDLLFAYITNKVNNVRIINDVLFKKYVADLKEIGAQNPEKLAYRKLTKQNILIDEGHKLLNEGDVCLNFIFYAVKMLRKYYAGLTFVTQNVSDFSKDGENNKKAEAIITNTPARMLMLTDSVDLEGVVKLLKYDGGLTQEEINYILNAGDGKGVFMTHSKNRHCIQVQLSETEWNVISDINDYD